jgi:hypothetical protein
MESIICLQFLRRRRSFKGQNGCNMKEHSCANSLIRATFSLNLLFNSEDGGK